MQAIRDITNGRETSVEVNLNGKSLSCDHFFKNLFSVKNSWVAKVQNAQLQVAMRLITRALITVALIQGIMVIRKHILSLATVMHHHLLIKHMVALLLNQGNDWKGNFQKSKITTTPWSRSQMPLPVLV
nr:hypothetical protein Iba_scaffold14370CG0290 [Ipomoea batatas]GME18083.1 hypothetical protein Iba_scaffold19920CG0010 [Ipomoea batatas]